MTFEVFPFISVRKLANKEIKMKTIALPVPVVGREGGPQPQWPKRRTWLRSSHGPFSGERATTCEVSRQTPGSLPVILLKCINPGQVAALVTTIFNSKNSKRHKKITEEDSIPSWQRLRQAALQVLPGIQSTTHLNACRQTESSASTRPSRENPNTPAL
jgi:diacylglycerol kinase family enzyme